MSKILVIDDDEALRRMFDSAMRFFGHEVRTVDEGARGLEAAREWLPDVIFCDINMPEMDGRAVLQTLRADPKLAHRQIVLMTGNQAENTQRDGMNLGADDYLSKPFELSQLRICVEARLRRAQIYRRIEDGMLQRHADLVGSTLPHEFMTPLHGILGFSEILREDLGRIPLEEARQMLTDIGTSARRLQRTLQNYIMLVTLETETGKLPALATLDGDRAASLIGDAAQSAGVQAGRRADLTLAVETVPFACREQDLRVIVGQLAENAFAYSDGGTGVRVALQRGQGGPALSVKDHGRGMTPEQIERIGLFMQFERERFEQQGLGIGLALVKGLLGRNGGRIRFESAPGHGTTVLVEFQPGA